MSTADMGESIVGVGWLWPVLALVFAVLWLWTALRLRRAAPEARPSASGSVQRSVEVEDALKVAYGLQETGSDALDDEELAQCMGFPRAMGGDIVGALVAFGWAKEEGQGQAYLTEEGKARARELIRAHRLWEHYLVKREGMPLEAVHAEAHRREHETSSEELERLDEELSHPAWDPHGHAIPAAGSPARCFLWMGWPRRFTSA